MRAVQASTHKLCELLILYLQKNRMHDLKHTSFHDVMITLIKLSSKHGKLENEFLPNHGGAFCNNKKHSFLIVW